MPQPFWAVLLALLGVLLELALLFVPGATEATRHDVAMAAFGLISGAVGAFKATSSTTSSVTTPAATVTSTTGGAATFPDTTTKIGE